MLDVLYYKIFGVFGYVNIFFFFFIKEIWYGNLLCCIIEFVVVMVIVGFLVLDLIGCLFLVILFWLILNWVFLLKSGVGKVFFGFVDFFFYDK